jgi:small-conductance mechanosensitive channel
MNQVQLPIDKIEYFIQMESFATLLTALVLGWIFYKIFLKKISEKRHLALKKRFFKTSMYLAISALLALTHWNVVLATWTSYHTLKVANYIGLLSFIILVTVLIRLAHIYIYLYLFLANMSVGVPRLIANLLTLLFSTFIISWIASDVFGFHIATVLATSAIFTIVLGLALQDTLGNLFSGVALQIERPFQLGDWVEIHNGNDKWVGQIQEITWRATSLIGFGDELIVIPNRTIAQSQLLIFSHLHKPARFSQVLRFKFDVSIADAKAAILEGVSTVPEILSDPEPRVLVMEVTESWVAMKVFYSINDYGSRYRTGDRVITNILESIRLKKLVMATSTLSILRDQSEEVDHD